MCIIHIGDQNKIECEIFKKLKSMFGSSKFEKRIIGKEIKRKVKGKK